jgi:hypothetical protein
MEAKMGWVVDVVDVLDPFDFEMFLFQKHMGAQVTKVIKPSFCFLIAYDAHQVHNMFALMLDPCFKFLRVLENYVGWGNVICLATKYDAKVVIPLLMIIFYVLNLTIQAFTTQFDGSYVGAIVVEEEDNNIFGVNVSIEKFSYVFVVGELYLFKRLFIVPIACVDPLACWCIHETQFPNVGFLAKQILGILGSQIEIECVFNLVNVLTTLQCY